MRFVRSGRRSGLVFRALIPLLLVGAFTSARAGAATIVVNTLERGAHLNACEWGPSPCSLRDAIIEANAGPSVDTIEFGVSGTIDVGTEELPEITEPVTIDATTAPGYAGTPVVTLEGDWFNYPREEIEEDVGLNLGEETGGSRIEGLSIGGFWRQIVVGDRLDAAPPPTYICADYVGVRPDGDEMVESGGQIGIVSLARDLHVGAGCPLGNLISGDAYGVLDGGIETQVAANTIGTDASGDPLLTPEGHPSSSIGVYIDAEGRRPFVGGDPEVGYAPNVIAYNGYAGVAVEDETGAVIRRNSIFGNGETGIDITGTGGPPAPMLGSAAVRGAATELTGSLQGEPNTAYSLDFFVSQTCGPGGSGEGQEYLGTATVESDASGSVSFDAAGLEPPAIAGEFFTATATAEGATSETSSFSRCFDQPPTTTIGSSPPDRSGSTEATFAFSGADAAGKVVGFECALDGAGFESCSSPKALVGLAEGRHEFSVRAVDKGGAVDPTPATYTWTVEGAPPPAAPRVSGTTSPGKAPVAAVNGRSVELAPEVGKVFVKRPGQKRATLLKEGQTIPIGSLVDAIAGKVLLNSVDPGGEDQSAVFYGGEFQIAQQEGSGLVVLKLRGGDLSACNAGGGESAHASVAPHGRKLWGTGHGNFRTEGNDGSATVRGTIWLTEDRCDGTFFEVRRGIVSVRDFTLGKTFAVPAGRSYFARAP